MRTYYAPFESELRSGTAQVYYHEIPGGQYSNYKPQVEGLGLGHRWEECKKMYRQVNDIVITSYSIHYTKLYEIWRCGNRSSTPL